jgi:putative membrane protein
VVRFLATTTLALIGNAVGLIVAAVILDDMALNGAAFIVAVLIFTLAFVILQPLSVKMALRHSATLAGGSALLATLLALIVTDVLSDGLSISGTVTWLLATLIVWLVGVLAGLILPLLLFKKALGRANGAPTGRPGTSWG